MIPTPVIGKDNNLEFRVAKSPLQVELEFIGCVFNGQERLDNHERDRTKPCQCGRKPVDTE